MRTKLSNYRILIVEDNKGDLLLIQEYLDEYFISSNLVSAKTFAEAKNLLQSPSNAFDIILLDLSLPDLDGMSLLDQMVPLSGDAPIVILTGYSNVPFSSLTLGQGASDYLLKDELTPFSLYKSVVHNIERKKHVQEIENSREEYTDLFELSPQPLIIYNTNDMSIIKVNDAACHLYGYTMEEFSHLNLLDIRPASEESYLRQEFKKITQTDMKSQTYVGVFKHQKKNGEVFTVEAYSNPASRVNENVRVSLINDVSEKLNYIKKIEDQNARLKDIAWIQSHIVRSPLSRIMGLVNLLSDEDLEPTERRFILEKISESSQELDHIIHDITEKASQLKREES
ncbi:response regulator [Nonlabens agnitus]|uniref:histidine kinase n=1 Tax=Nonlabens agnitus TaxID=870484 RepID=A0A2S9WQQ6_9FLAO|nr:response regulator [Nonlabens agnitus]PRP65830.1 hypothetical protein BST86_01350 [Nonlabens agnitus]